MNSPVESATSAPGVESIRLDAELEELARLTDFLDAYCGRHGIPEGAHYQINVALEEVVINAIKHGNCNPARGAIEVALSLAGAELKATVTDTGIPFNPLEAPPPDLGPDLASRKIGGLGIHLVRSLMQSVEYERLAGGNRLRLTKNVQGESDADTQ